MKIALICCLLQCLLMIVIGVLVWFSYGAFIVKLVYSIAFVLAGIALGCTTIQLLRDEYA